MSQVGTLQGPGIPPSTKPLVTSPPPPRRSRAVACAECRRLKLKCDRSFPCMNCRRRDVASLCPHGSLITRSRVTTSAIAEGTGRKHNVKWMIERIRRLENALALVQAKVSHEPHPLLSAAARMGGCCVGTSEQSDNTTVMIAPTPPTLLIAPMPASHIDNVSEDKRSQKHSTDP